MGPSSQWNDISKSDRRKGAKREVDQGQRVVDRNTRSIAARMNQMSKKRISQREYEDGNEFDRNQRKGGGRYLVGSHRELGADGMQNKKKGQGLKGDEKRGIEVAVHETEDVHHKWNHRGRGKGDRHGQQIADSSDRLAADLAGLVKNS